MLEEFKLGSGDKPVNNVKISQMLPFLTCQLCTGVYRDAHTINECMCTFCKACIIGYFQHSVTRSKCPSCNAEIGGRPLDTLVKDITL